MWLLPTACGKPYKSSCAGRWPSGSIPYFEKILVKKPNTQEIANIIRSALMEFDEVKNVKSCVVEFDEDERKCTCRFTVETSDEIIESEVEYT